MLKLMLPFGRGDVRQLLDRGVKFNNELFIEHPFISPYEGEYVRIWKFIKH